MKPEDYEVEEEDITWPNENNNQEKELSGKEAKLKPSADDSSPADFKKTKFPMQEFSFELPKEYSQNNSQLPENPAMDGNKEKNSKERLPSNEIQKSRNMNQSYSADKEGGKKTESIPSDYSPHLPQEKKSHKKLLVAIIIITTIFGLMIIANLTWKNITLQEIADKNLTLESNPIFNNNFNDQDTNNYEHKIYNNYTIINNNTIILPEELLIKLTNITND